MKEIAQRLRKCDLGMKGKACRGVVRRGKRAGI